MKTRNNYKKENTKRKHRKTIRGGNDKDNKNKPTITDSKSQTEFNNFMNESIEHNVLGNEVHAILLKTKSEDNAEIKKKEIKFWDHIKNIKYEGEKEKAIALASDLSNIALASDLSNNVNVNRYWSAVEGVLTVDVSVTNIDSFNFDNINVEPIIEIIKQERQIAMTELQEHQEEYIGLRDSDPKDESTINKKKDENKEKENKIKIMDFEIEYWQKSGHYWKNTCEINKNILTTVKKINEFQSNSTKNDDEGERENRSALEKRYKLGKYLKKYMNGISKSGGYLFEITQNQLKGHYDGEKTNYKEVKDKSGEKDDFDADIQTHYDSLIGIITTNNINENENDNDIELRKDVNNIVDGIENFEKVKEENQEEAMKSYRLKVQKVISKLGNDETYKLLNDIGKRTKKGGDDSENKSHDNNHNNSKKLQAKKNKILKILKNRITSEPYVDYEVDTLIETFFPNAFALKMGMDPNPKTIETKQKYETYMYANPISNEELNPKNKSVRAKEQKDEDFGIDYTVLRNDPNASNSDMAMSEMIGIENMLYILNQTGSNTRYLKDYFHGKDDKGETKPKMNPMHVNKHSVHRKYVNKLLRQPSKNPLKDIGEKINEE
jgi:hypothetical protein